MKQLTKILCFAILAAILSSCSGESNRNEIRWTGENDTINCTMIIGSEQGGTIEIVTDKEKYNKLINLYLKKEYASEQYSTFLLEFIDQRLTLVDSDLLGLQKQIVAPYQFKHDSLFAYKSNAEILFIALGNQSELYRYFGASQSIVNKTGDAKPTHTPFVANRQITEEDALKAGGFTKISEVTNPKDTLIWVNFKYKFN